MLAAFTPKVIVALLIALGVSILLNIGAGVTIARMLEGKGKAAEALETARQDAKGHEGALDKALLANAECRQRLGATLQAGELAISQRDSLQEQLNRTLQAEATLRENLYLNDPACGAMSRCRVCDPIADRLRNPPRPRAAGRGD